MLNVFFDTSSGLDGGGSAEAWFGGRVAGRVFLSMAWLWFWIWLRFWFGVGAFLCDKEEEDWWEHPHDGNWTTDVL